MHVRLRPNLIVEQGQGISALFVFSQVQNQLQLIFIGAATNAMSAYNIQLSNKIKIEKENLTGV